MSSEACRERQSKCPCANSDEHAMRSAIAEMEDENEALKAQLTEASAVVWGPVGLDRVHVESGTAWKWEEGAARWVADLPRGEPFWRFASASVERHSSGKWKWRASPPTEMEKGVGFAGDPRAQRAGISDSEGDAMRLALDAAGWRKP